YMELLQTMGVGSGATPAGQLAAQLGGVDGTQVNVGGTTVPVGVQPTVQPATAIGFTDTQSAQSAQQAAPTQPAMVTPEAIAAARAEFEAAQRDVQSRQAAADALNDERIAAMLGITDATTMLPTAQTSPGM